MKGAACTPWLDTSLNIGREQINENGEDSSAFCLMGSSAFIGVFDGLGGSGAKRCEKLGGYTGAYIASRVVSGAARTYFERAGSARFDAAGLKGFIMHCLKKCEKAKAEEKSSLKGAFLDFPTTACVAACTHTESGVLADFYWAGDSRGFFLCEEGLIQITHDDSGAADIRSRMNSDAPMNNVISLSRPWVMHRESLLIRKKTPGIFFTATDGCFDYWRSPIDFEFQLLDTLENSISVIDWQKKLDSALNEVAGDDFTLCGLAFGFGSFDETKRRLKQRRDALRDKYIAPMENMEHEQVLDMWVEYSRNYLWEQKKVHLKNDSGVILYP